MRGLVAIFVGLAMLAGSVQAADRPVPPPVPPLDTMHARTVKAVFAQTFKLGGKQFAFKDVLIAKLPQTVGAGAVNTLSGLAWVCFDLPAGQRIWFSGEGQADFNTITLARRGAASSHCPAMPAKYTPVVIDTDIRIGMTKPELLKRLGQPSRQVDSWMVYGNEHGDSRIGLAIQFDGEKAVFISASNWPFN